MRKISLAGEIQLQPGADVCNGIFLDLDLTFAQLQENMDIISRSFSDQALMEGLSWPETQSMHELSHEFVDRNVRYGLTLLLIAGLRRERDRRLAESGARSAIDKPATYGVVERDAH